MVVSTQLTALIKRELASLVAVRHDLHANPEIGLCETRTSTVIQNELTALGIQFDAGLAGGTGVLAHLPGTSDNTVGLRADIDALPITEETGLPYASTKPGVMHACGHDGHTTILLGVARVLSALAKTQALPRPVTLLFQPAEENLGGATRMISDGCLAGRIGSPMKEIYGLHGWPWLPVGTVGVRNGAALAATDYFSITVHGLGAHAACPHESNDPIVAVAGVINALQTIVSRNTDPIDAVVVSICVIHAGHAFNVIPQECKIEGTIRTLDSTVRTRTIKRIEEIAQHGASMQGCTVTTKIMSGCPATINHPEATDFVRHAASQIAGAQLVELTAPFMGGEDFAYYGRHIPASFFMLGLQNPHRPSMPGLHHPGFDFNDDALATGIETMCRIALKT